MGAMYYGATPILNAFTGKLTQGSAAGFASTECYVGLGTTAPTPSTERGEGWYVTYELTSASAPGYSRRQVSGGAVKLLSNVELDTTNLYTFVNNTSIITIGENTDQVNSWPPVNYVLVFGAPSGADVAGESNYLTLWTSLGQSVTVASGNIALFKIGDFKIQMN